MAKRLIYVDVVRAKNIVGINKRAGNSDPYIIGVLENVAGREIKAEKFQTKTVTKTLTPEWKEKFTFGNGFDLDSVGDLPTLVLKMYHKAGYMMTDEFMGKVSIPLDMVDPSGNPSSGWYPVVGDARSKFQASGEIFLTMKFSAAATDIEGGYGDYDGGEVGEAELGEDADEFPNELNITIIQGKNLPIMDKALFGG